MPRCARTGADWIVVERDFAADAGRVRKLLLDAAALKIVEEKTSDSKRYADLSVEDVAAVSPETASAPKPPKENPLRLFDARRRDARGFRHRQAGMEPHQRQVGGRQIGLRACGGHEAEPARQPPARSGRRPAALARQIYRRTSRRRAFRASP